MQGGQPRPPIHLSSPSHTHGETEYFHILTRSIFLTKSYGMWMLSAHVQNTE